MNDWSFSCVLPDGITSVTLLPAGIQLSRKNGSSAQHSFDDLLGKVQLIGWADQRLAEAVRGTKKIYPILDAEVRAGRLAGTYDELASIAAGRVPLRGFGDSKRALLARVLDVLRSDSGV